jgi:hypothetical protein
MILIMRKEFVVLLLYTIELLVNLMIYLNIRLWI